MTKFWVTILPLFLLFAMTLYVGQATALDMGKGADKKTQVVAPAGSQPSSKGPAEFFTGNVRIDPLYPADGETNFSAAYVTFEPGARSNWHTHPCGQRLIVVAGVGLTQEWGGPVVEIKPGDVVICPAEVKHWHGASPTTGMTHIAMTGMLDGKNVEWMERVSDRQYSGK